MKKRELSRQILLGIASGLVVVAQADLEANQIDPQQLLAAHKCNSKSGCGELTAYRDRTKSSQDDQEGDFADQSNSEEEDEAQTESAQSTSFQSQTHKAR